MKLEKTIICTLILASMLSIAYGCSKEYKSSQANKKESLTDDNSNKKVRLKDLINGNVPDTSEEDDVDKIVNPDNCNKGDITLLRSSNVKFMNLKLKHWNYYVDSNHVSKYIYHYKEGNIIKQGTIIASNLIIVPSDKNEDYITFYKLDKDIVIGNKKFCLGNYDIILHIK